MRKLVIVGAVVVAFGSAGAAVHGIANGSSGGPLPAPGCADRNLWSGGSNAGLTTVNVHGSAVVEPPPASA